MNSVAIICLRVLFLEKNKDYYINSMSCCVDLTVDVTKQPQSDKIKEISDLGNANLGDSVDFGYKKCYTNNI